MSTVANDDDLILTFDGPNAAYCIDLPRIGRVCLGAAKHIGGDFRPSEAAIAKLLSMGYRLVAEPGPVRGMVG